MTKRGAILHLMRDLRVSQEAPDQVRGCGRGEFTRRGMGRMEEVKRRYPEGKGG